MTPKPKTKKAVRRVKKAWICFYWNTNSLPSILWKRPTKKEMQSAQEFGGDIYPCTISYSLPPLTKKG